MELFFAWLSIVVVFFLIELLGVALFFFFSFALGALATAFISLYTQVIAYQLLCFLLTSPLFFLLLRVVFNPKRIGKVTLTNVARLPGMRGIVIKSIAPGISGQVKIEGIIWSARGVMGEVLVEGMPVEVVSVKGSHVIVCSIETRE